mgnify:CR=1 FL=1
MRVSFFRFMLVFITIINLSTIGTFGQKVGLQANLDIVKVSKKQLLAKITITNLDTASHTIIKPVVEWADYSLFKAFIIIPEIKRKYTYYLKYGFGKIKAIHLTHEAYVTLRQNESFSKVISLDLDNFTDFDVMKYKDKILQIFIDYGNIRFESDCIKKFYTGKLKIQGKF